MKHTFLSDLRSWPNLVTLSRIAFLLAGSSLYLGGWPLLGLLFGTIGGLTDYLDGWLARRLNQVTRLGEILDQTCDMMFEAMVILMAVTPPEGFSRVLVLLYLPREFWVMAIRRYTAEHHVNIPSTIFGKLKTNFIGWGCIPTFAHLSHILPPALDPYARALGLVGFWGGVTFAWISAFQYSRAFVRGYDEVAAR